ncbi:MAG: transporter substrate-binding domain-containing protein, partial [Anaerolineales bacterium]|nr:transporter substrate-binding domain-containing protein [Anaerolineales bacterium]
MQNHITRYRFNYIFRITLVLLGIILISARMVAADALIDSNSSSVISSGAEIDYPPFSIVNDAGEVSGFSVELMRAALAAMGRDVTFRTGPWAEVRGWLEQGEIQALPLVGRTPERESRFDFTVPYMSLHGAIVIRKSETSIKTLTDLRGRRVAVMKGDNAEEFLKREDRDFDIQTTSTFEMAMHQLAAGQYDAVVIQRLVALRLIQKTGLTELQVIDRPIEGFKQDFCFAVREGDRDTLALLNEGLAIVMADGTYRHLHAKWFADMQLPSDRPIVVGGDRNFPPYEYLDENGHPSGYNVDLTRAIAREMGLNIEIRLGRWPERMNALKTQKIDVIQGMFYSANRDQYFDFTPAHTVSHYVAVVRKGEGPAPETIEALADKRIVVERGDILHDFAVEHGLENQITIVGDQEEALRELAEGKHDCALVSRITVLFLIDKHGWTNLVLGKKPLLVYEYCYAVANGQQALLAQFSEGLKALENSGEYRQIYDKWLGVYKKQPMSFLTALRYTAMIIIPLLLMLSAAFIWTWTLHRNVAEKTKALQASETRYRRLFECAQDGILILDAETGEVVDVNPYLLQLLGYDRGALVGKPLWDIGPFHDIAASRDLFRVLQEREYVRYEHLPLQSASGGLVDVEFVSNVYLANDLKVIQCNIRDVTERKCAEEALNREHAMLARTEAAAHVGSWEWEAEGDKVTWSDELFRIFGLEPADEAPPFAEHQTFYVPEDRARLAQAVEECVTNGMPYDLEVRVLRCDGELRHCLVRGFPEHDTDGAVKRLYGSLQDITEIRRQEERITTLSYMLDDAPASITIHDTDGRFLFANAATASLHGYESMEGFMEINLHELDVPESEAAIAERMREIAEEGEARFEVEHYRKDSSTFPLDVLAKRIEWEGRPAILSIASDITERRMAEDRLKRSYELLEKLAAQVPGVIYQYRLFPDGRSCFPYASPGMWEIYEVTPEEVEQDATPVFGRLHSEDATRVSEAIFESAHTLETFYCEFRVVLPDQGLRWRWSQAEPQRTEDGGTLWHGIILDITDRKQAEEALRHSHELMQYIIEHSNGGVAVHDRDLRYTFVSQRYLKDYGVQEPNIIGKHHYDVFPGLPEKWREVHRKALAGEVSRSERDPYERADGTVEWTRWECRPWYEKAGDIGGIIVYTEMITERVKAEETLIRQQRSIELSNR